MPTDIKVLLVTSPAWIPVRCGRQGLAIVVNQAPKEIQVGTLNVNTLRGRIFELVEILSPRKVVVCCIQQTRYHGGNCRTIKGKDTRYKLCWSGNDKGTAGVGVFVAEEWIKFLRCRESLTESSW